MATTSPAKRSRKRIFSEAGPGGPWSDAAPRSVCEEYGSQRDAEGWAAWCKHLARRKRPTLGELLPGKRSPLAWGVPEDEIFHEALQLADLLQWCEGPARRTKGLEEAAERWMGTAATAPPTAAWALSCLAWAGALPRLAEKLGEQSWWAMLNRLVSLASASGQCDDVWASQLLFAELPLTLAQAFPELEACRALAEPGRRALDEAFEQLLDGEGLLQGRYLPLLRPLVACWTRCGVLGQQEPECRWGEASASQYPQLLQHALRLSRSNGQEAFASAEAPRWNANFLRSVLKLAGDRPTERLLRLVEEGSKPDAKSKQLPPPCFHGEWAGVAVLRTDWRRNAARLTVEYDGPRVQTELSFGPRLLWSGEWPLEVRLNDQILAASGAWEHTCWQTDEDVDYLELELRLERGVVVQRHILLARKEGFAFLADAVLGSEPGTLDYRSTLPLGNWSTFVGERETREGNLLLGEQPRARILPLAMNEWQAAPARGHLRASESGLELAQSAQQTRLFAPLWIDLDPTRLKKEVTWRQLTVAEKREIVPGETAVGYRVQVGKSQWLVYRSLGEKGTRTVLSKNLSGEFLVGVFGADGKTTTLLEIE